MKGLKLFVDEETGFKFEYICRVESVVGVGRIIRDVLMMSAFSPEGTDLCSYVDANFEAFTEAKNRVEIRAKAHIGRPLFYWV